MRRHRTWLRRGSVLALILSVATVPAAGAEPRSPAGDSVKEAALARIDRIRAGVSSGSLEEAIRTAAAESGVHLAPTPVAAPGSLAEVADFLSGSVASAERDARRAVADPEGLAALHTEFQLTAMVRQSSSTGEGRERLESLARRIDALVDEALLFGAAGQLGAALDSALPRLRTLAAASGEGNESVAACDTLDTPAVCVGGTGPNTYTADHRLIIDLGGNDTYANSAGGADPGLASAVTGGGGNGLTVSVNIDLGGNDTYATELATASGSHVAQGAGFLGGIGILVDEGGNDVYETTSLKSFPESYGALAQGFAEYASIGVLADSSGDDVYRLISHSWDPVGAYGVAFGHGLAGAGAAALLLDGSGNDSYLAEHEPTPRLLDGGVLHLGAPTVISGGAAAEGVGVLADGGGVDQMAIRAATRPIEPNDPTEFQTPPAVFAEGFGFSGLGGVGVALSGDGPTSWSVRAESLAPRTSAVSSWGFGATSFGSFAAVEDRGGNDSYALESVIAAESTRSASEGCGCGGAIASATGYQSFAGGGGHGAAGAVGVMLDAGGDDRYRFASTTSVRAEARDEQSAGASGGADAHALGELGAVVESLGYGLLGGAGLTIDEDGDDRYEISATSTSSAVASAVSPDAPVEATAQAFGARVNGMGASAVGGYGELSDLDGKDEYHSNGESTASASPETLVEAGGVTVGFVGSVEFSAARFTDQDGGASDVFALTPGDPACQGVRGEDVWVDCGVGSGVGVNQ